MTPWNIALGNVGRGSTPSPKPALPVHQRKSPVEPTCPHCGMSLRKPEARKLWSSQEDGTLIAMLEAGDTHKAIASALGRPISSIASRINTLELPGRYRKRGDL